MNGKFLLTSLFLLALTTFAAAQPKGYIISARNAEPIATEDGLRTRVEFLSDSLLTGRASGTPGSIHAQACIAREFAAAGLVPANDSWYRGFRTVSGARAYPGADSNASGVAAMLTLARMFQKMKELGKTYSSTIIFVALDGKEQSLSGANHLWSEIDGGRLSDPKRGVPVLAKDIDRMVNIDQVGGTEAPLKSRRPDYLMMLSEPENGRRDALLIANMSPEVSLDVAFDYYGSKDFTRVFFRTISDQKPFLDNGIPSVMFTSGITLRNNKANDTADSLDYGILRRRVLAMFYYLVRVI